MRRLDCLISLLGYINQQSKLRINVKLKRLVRLISLTSSISAEEIQNKCKIEASWVSCASHFASKLNISSENER